MAWEPRTDRGRPSPLVEIGHFGTNPGALRMFAFVPEQLPRAPALVVVLHGCGQTAAGYDSAPDGRRLRSATALPC